MPNPSKVNKKQLRGKGNLDLNLKFHVYYVFEFLVFLQIYFLLFPRLNRRELAAYVSVMEFYNILLSKLNKDSQQPDFSLLLNIRSDLF